MMNNVLFIHGFNSSPLSAKAQLTKNYLAQHFPDVKFYCPQVATTPKVAIAQLEQYFIDNNSPIDTWALIGSSLGGYFSTYLSEVYGVKAVLINPAIKPYELLTDYIGEQVNPYTQERYQVESNYLNDLIALEQSTVSKEKFMLMVQTGDEVLNYQQAIDKFQGSKVIVQQGGDHSFVDYQNMLPQIVEFLQLKE
jgi:predicted esterase YcpF (UPF0227 family)